MRASFRSAILAICCLLMMTASADAEITKFVRFQVDDKTYFGIVEDEQIRKINGDLFGEWSQSDATYAIDSVKILVPTAARKVLALAGNYRDHLSDDDPIPTQPEPFFKLPTSLIADGEKIVQPNDHEQVHYEAEVVIVIGKKAKHVSEADALDYVLGITCGNDISARNWQANDRQWWRAKSSDTFGPCGPFIVSGLDYGNLKMELRVNGEVRQKTNTKNMIFNIAQTVSFISRYVTLEPGDLIYSGTPGKTKPMNNGDIVEVEIEGVGILTNQLVGAK